MRHILRGLAVLTFSLVPFPCDAQGITRADLANHVLDFEDEQTGGVPKHWGGVPAGTIFTDEKIVHGGKWAVRLDRTAGSAGQFSTITIGIPVDFTGAQLELRGFLKTEDVSDFTGLWLREDGDAGSVAFDNMQRRAVRGTSDWKEYSIVVPLDPEAKRLVFGFLLTGTGKGWADDLRLLVDGRPIWDAPAAERLRTAIDRDHEFDAGSKITLETLSKVQVENLAMLGKVWGFVKYHHPLVAAGDRQWDYDLFRVLPDVLAARDRADAAAVMHRGIASLGDMTACAQCAVLDTRALSLKPALEWISDEKLLGSELSADLRRIYTNRAPNQYYVSLARGVGNPVFGHDPAYPRIKFPDAGFQLLALYRFWNIIEYWYPNREITGDKWDAVLQDSIPRIALAADGEAYKRELIRLIALVRDTHANLWSSLPSRPPVGDCQMPVVLRFVEGKAVVTGSAAKDGATGGLRAGDVIEELDGTPVASLVERWEPYYADSNDAARRRDIARYMTRGMCGPSAVRIARGTETLMLDVARVPSGTLDPLAGATHDRPGNAFQKLSNDVAYLKLSAVTVADAARYVNDAQGTKGLIIDIRNYPSEFVVFALGSLLVDKPADFVRFTIGDLANPGAFHWGEPLRVMPAQPHYGGRVVIVVDEVTQSQAEYTAMAFRVAPNAVVVGSTTAGADGNVSRIALPGGLQAMISGIGVFYPNRKPTQQVGIVADVPAKPTVAGIRAGRDEVLEVAIRQIVGAGIPQAKIEAMTRH